VPAFEYKGRTKAGELRSGIIEASSREAALDILQQNELLILALEEKVKSSPWDWSLGIAERVSQKDIVVFMRQLATLFEAKIPVAESLKTLVAETAKTRLRSIIAEVLDDVTGGMALSQALAKHPTVFSDFTVNLVRSGEESGKLEEVFSYLADYLERSHYLTTRARNALIYPIFIFVTFLGVLTVLLVVVIPRLTSIFEETGQAVPFYTQAVISLSYFLRQWGLVLLFLLVVGVLAAWRWSRTQPGRVFFHQLQLELPLFGNLYRKLFMARFSDNLQTMIVSGIPIVRALSVSAEVVGNEIYRRAIQEAIESVKAGSTIALALEKTPQIPALVTQMIRIGETTGKLDFILGSVAKYYQREVDSMMDNLVALIEPALIIFLGVSVGILVGAVMVPLYNLVGAI